MEQSVGLDLGHTATEVVEVVALQGHHVVVAVQVDTPVVVAVAGGGVVGATIDEGVRDGDPVVGVGAEDDVLTANAGGGNVVDPDQVGVVDGDGVTTPDVLGVDVGDGNVLDDDVLGTADDAETLALDHTLGSHTHDTLVGVDGDGEDTGLVARWRSAGRVHERSGHPGDLLSKRHLGGVGLVVIAPAVQVDGLLALRCSAPGQAAAGGLSALGAREVEAAGVG